VKKDELQLPMDMIVGFANKLDANLFRERILEVETEVHGSQPLLVFDNHDNMRSWERYGDGVHNVAIAKLIATMLFTTRATALMYYGEELGMTDREDGMAEGEGARWRTDADAVGCFTSAGWLQHERDDVAAGGFEL
jgi:glycosidase